MDSAAIWKTLPVVAPLEPDAVQVWRVSLDQPARVVAGLVGLLSDDERTRADRFLFDHLRTRYIVARSTLRRILGVHAGRDPAALPFAYAQQGKPSLPGSPLRFNVSHAHQFALIACTLAREIGIDIEYHREMPEQDQLAERFFSKTEAAEYLSLPPAERRAAFYRCWTRKEAYIKALGDGLRYPLDAFRVSLLPGEPARLISVDGQPEETERWKMEALDPGPDYTGALLVEGWEWRLETAEFRV